MLAGLRPAAPWSAVLARGSETPGTPQPVALVGGSASALLSRPARAAPVRLPGPGPGETVRARPGKACRAAHTSRAINAIPFSVVAGVGYDWRMSNGQRQAALELT